MNTAKAKQIIIFQQIRTTTGTYMGIEKMDSAGEYGF